ncbi:hypothetical protein LEMLEM_LOCUS21233 [Lemmus lemmus]
MYGPKCMCYNECSAYGGQKREPEPLDMEFQMAVSHLMWTLELETNPGPLKEQQEMKSQMAPTLMHATRTASQRPPDKWSI